MKFSRLSTFLVGLLSLVASVVQAESYPLIVANVKEVGHVHEEIDNLRKSRIDGYISANDAMRAIAKMLVDCPSNTFLIIDQPGVELSDFQSLVTPSGIHLWAELRKFLQQCATLASFPRLDGPIDLDKLERSLRNKCEARTIQADPQKDPPFKRYDDTEPRVIRLNFEPLPDDDVQREIQLKRNDDMIQEAFKQTPTPMFTLIYTSTLGEEYDPSLPEYKGQKFWDIFPDIVRAKRDPRNRYHWKNQEGRKKIKSASNEPISKLPPYAENKRQEAKKKILKDKAKLRKSEGSSGEQAGEEEVLSKDTVGMILFGSVGLGIAYMVFKAVWSVHLYFNSADMSNVASGTTLASSGKE